MNKKEDSVRFSKTYHNDSGAEIEILVKAERPTNQREMRKTLSFVATSSQKFYLDLASELVVGLE